MSELDAKKRNTIPDASFASPAVPKRAELPRAIVSRADRERDTHFKERLTFPSVG